MTDHRKYVSMSDDLYDYAVRHGTPPDDIQRDLIEETATLGDHRVMQVAPDQGAFMTLLTRAIGAREAIELGTFTGYSALCIARGLPADGRLICCDVSDEWTAIARRYWERAGVQERIDLRIGPASETIASIPAEPRFDLAFLDADKESQLEYYEALLPRMRRNALILVDNVFSSNRILEAAPDSTSTRAMQEFNDVVASDNRVDRAILSIADGLTILRVRAPTTG